MTEQIIKLDLDMTERDLLKEFSKRSKILYNKVKTDYVRVEIMGNNEPNPKRMYEAIRKLEKDITRCQNFLSEVSTVIDNYHRENDIGSRGNLQ
tara:strand:- start:11975 stop:12256 length:282 start_codon:yes stop_codon:yes gene_type:complete